MSKKTFINAIRAGDKERVEPPGRNHPYIHYMSALASFRFRRAISPAGVYVRDRVCWISETDALGWTLVPFDWNGGAGPTMSYALQPSARQVVFSCGHDITFSSRYNIIYYANSPKNIEKKYSDMKREFLSFKTLPSSSFRR